MNIKMLIGFIVAAALLISLGFVFINPSSTTPTENIADSGSVEAEKEQEPGAPVSSPETTAPDAGGAMVATYTLADIAEHVDSESCWTSIEGSVYDLTPFISSHPGGIENIMKLCGIDGTEAFTAQHGGGKKQQSVLTGLLIGELSN